MGNDEEDYGDEYGSSEEGSYLDIPVAEDDAEQYEYYDEEDPAQEESEEYYDEEQEVEELTKGRKKSVKATPGETPGNQE